MRDLEFIITIMTTIENNVYFNSTKENEKYIDMYNEEYENKKNIKKLLNNALTFIKELELNPYSIWQKKSNIFTLIIEILNLQYSNNLDTKTIRNILNSFEKNMLENKNCDPDKNDYAKYYIHSLQGTNSKQSRITRGTILKTYLIEHLS